MWALARSYFFFLWDLECCRQAEMPGDHFCCKMVKILLLSFKHDFFMYKCDWFFFLHFCLLCATLFTRQLKWPLWAILCRCEADFSCVVTLRQEVRARLRSHPSSADHLHQLSKAKSDRSNGFCVIYAEEPALCHPLWRTWRSQGEVQPSRVVKCPSCLGPAVLLRGLCHEYMYIYLHICKLL